MTVLFGLMSDVALMICVLLIVSVGSSFSCDGVVERCLMSEKYVNMICLMIFVSCGWTR